MTHEEYESRYAEALDNLKRTLRDISEPATTSAGTRFIHVDGTPCNDEMIFTLAWGEELARKIVAQRWMPLQ